MSGRGHLRGSQCSRSVEQFHPAQCREVGGVESEWQGNNGKEGRQGGPGMQEEVRMGSRNWFLCDMDPSDSRTWTSPPNSQRVQQVGSFINQGSLNTTQEPPISNSQNP